MFHFTNVGLQDTSVQVNSKYLTKNALQVTSEKNTPENRKTDNYIKTTVNNTSV